MARFTGKTALVTGAAQGLGREIAAVLARDGAAVLVVDLDAELAASTARELMRLGGSAAAVGADVSDRESMRHAFETCVDTLGTPGIVVAQAGGSGVRGVLDITDDEWQRMMAVNLNGVFITVQEGARLMAAGSGGSIVAVSSTNAFYVESDHAHYSTSKGAVTTFVRSAALDLGRYGIRVNAISPGVIRTRLSAHLTTDPVEGPDYLLRVPLGRFGEPADVANAVAFLASDDAAYVTGADLVVDGGATVGHMFPSARNTGRTTPAT
jgi:NAD(P)-dependent dehydrogenase (short-subunit alcohol dehydrogenase family)